eukprot:tig00000093_g3475.t1
MSALDNIDSKTAALLLVSAGAGAAVAALLLGRKSAAASASAEPAQAVYRSNRTKWHRADPMPMPMPTMACIMNRPPRGCGAVEPIINNKGLPQSHRETLEPGKEVWICRCWQSSTFPYCDGAHKKLNEKGDKVAPAGIKAADLPAKK